MRTLCVWTRTAFGVVYLRSRDDHQCSEKCCSSVCRFCDMLLYCTAEYGHTTQR
ncbi:hypothetical protein AG1IA_09159 [Rhizoctonia solani AG-1 IA]|uniref:Uncharacterized protein n=1 Tax=Thanatephorus cucumeris (strain AG1-IA) TaxID=983506 RepID=L8WJB9_THACA|nr:hypothetical protein AG1IA_09159 [Rhizoctonia solani AG-1 IA]